MTFYLKQLSDTFIQLFQKEADKQKIDNLVISSPFFHHAVASPLTCLNLSLHSAQQYAHSEHSQEVVSYLTLAKTATQRINNLLQLMDKHQHNSETFQLTRTIKQTIDLARLQHPDTFFQTTFPKNEMYFSHNIFLFQEVVTCLLNNAVESYTRGKPYVSVVVKKRKQKMVIVVSDGGCGMNALRKALVTNFGFTTKKSGNGIGLSFVKNYIEKELDGRVHISSKLGKGTQVELQIPL